ncbi:glycosyltransferase family 2 protein [Butyrivibrio sp. WCD3002]|uniref:glycosyltransferase family 2 protein n=1 Tax=Butyrivibrio sp. WCD3002 TaxID=1280676 RepID=UPI000401D0DD|nr:glycosyltransferase [Butyrivibrio sp. WCD3002]
MEEKNHYMEDIPIIKQNTLISIIVACYNVEQFLPRCIESIMAQTYKNLEIILIDDGARDNTGNICDHYKTLDERIVVVHQTNGGAAVARNEGIKLARGQYIGFVDGDDYIEPYMYEYMLSAMLTTDAELSVCRYFEDSQEDLKKARTYRKKGLVHIKDDGKAKEIVERGVRLLELTGGEALKEYVEESDKIVIRNAPWNKLYKAELLDEVSFPVQRYYEDILFSAQILSKVRKVAYIDTPLYHYIINRKGGAMGAGLRKEILTEQIPSYHARSELLEEIGRRDLAASHDYMVYKKLLLLYTEARRDKTGEKKKFMEPLAEEIKTCANQMYRVFSCDIADPHQKMRMELFLKNPKFYDLFMDLNEGIVLPLRQKFSGGHKK